MTPLQPLIRQLVADLEENWNVAHGEYCSQNCTSFGGTKECQAPRPASIEKAKRALEAMAKGVYTVELSAEQTAGKTVVIDPKAFK